MRLGSSGLLASTSMSIAAHGHLPEAAAQEASNQSWLKAKVETSLNDTRPNIPHDQVMAEMRAMLAAKKKTCATD